MISSLRLIAILEGISYLLLGITMPLKYSLNIPEPNYYVGMAHGLLFISYCAIVILIAIKMKWALKLILLSLLASLIPFGTFYADRKWFSKLQDSHKQNISQQ